MHVGVALFLLFAPLLVSAGAAAALARMYKQHGSLAFCTLTICTWAFSQALLGFVMFFAYEELSLGLSVPFVLVLWCAVSTSLYALYARASFLFSTALCFSYVPLLWWVAEACGTGGVVAIIFTLPWLLWILVFTLSVAALASGTAATRLSTTVLRSVRVDVNRKRP